MEACAIIDFETRSACPIRTHGSWRYSCDSTTEVLCMAFRLPHWEPGVTGLWHPAFPTLGIDVREDDLFFELIDWILDHGFVEAHNAWFERGVWTNIMEPRFNWPVIDACQWRCSAAKCAAHALPRGLDEAGSALGLSIRKDVVGGKLMKKLSKPRKPRKKEREEWIKVNGDAPMPILYWEKREWFESLFAYCRQDVLAENAISDAVPDLSPRELAVYLTDQTMNQRGFRLDVNGIRAAQGLLTQEQARLNTDMATLTDGAITKATQRAKLIQWCGTHGVGLPDTQAATVEALLVDPRELPDPVRRALSILQALGKSSTAKYEAMSRWVCPDDRAHGGLLYHAASTGRWGGQGIQPQNFPKGSITHWDMDIAWDILKTGDAGLIEVVFGSVMEALSQALRGAIIASPGRHLYVADYAAIEARVLLWLADDPDALAVFHRGEDIYCDMASFVYGRPVTPKDKAERSMGKVAILGLGYQMGAGRFVDTCLSYGIEIDENFARQVVDAYRSKYWRVKALWAEQEERAIQAVRNPEYVIPTGHVTWTCEDRYLYCILPSGRRLAYPDPEIHVVNTTWGKRPQLTFNGVDGLSHKWRRQHTYGGMLVENITQAVARDLLADAVLRCAESPIFTPILTVHDELIAEGLPGHDIHEFETLVAAVPSWATGCPVKAEGFAAERYRK